MIAYCCYHRSPYTTLASVLSASLADNAPTVTHICDSMDHWPVVGPDTDTGAFLRRWERWLWRVQTLNNETILLMDADMYVRGDISGLADLDGDVGVAYRGDNFYNGGLLAVRPTEPAHEFVSETVHRLYAAVGSEDKGENLRQDHGSVDQAALWESVKYPPDGCDVVELDCHEWDACDEHWADAVDTARIVHVKGELRDQCLGYAAVTDDLRPYVEEWNSYA